MSNLSQSLSHVTRARLFSLQPPSSKIPTKKTEPRSGIPFLLRAQLASLGFRSTSTSSPSASLPSLPSLSLPVELPPLPLASQLSVLQLRTPEQVCSLLDSDSTDPPSEARPPFTSGPFTSPPPRIRSPKAATERPSLGLQDDGRPFFFIPSTFPSHRQLGRRKKGRPSS